MSQSPEFTVTPYKLPDGTSDDFNFNISFDQPLSTFTSKEFLISLLEIPGVDAMAPVGRYTLTFSIGRHFDPKQVSILIRETLKKSSGGSVLSLPSKKLVVPK